MDSELASAPYLDPSLSAADRAADLLPRMTLEEKLAQLGGIFPRDISDAGTLNGRGEDLLRNGIGHVSHISAVTALAPEPLARLVNEIQRFLVRKTRLGIPAVVHGESCAGFTAVGATCFPQAIGLASTWDPALIEEMGRVISEQMRAVGVRHTLAPVLDIVRDARWGRCEETYGEDPYLAGRIGTAYVAGAQGDDLREGVVCTGKHFLGYGASEGGMNWAPAHVGDREMREVYAAPFRDAIRDARLASIMNSYAEIDGVPVGASRAVLTDLLREELGFEGTVVSDYYTLPTLETYHYVAGGRAEAAAAGLNAGIDVELPVLNCYKAIEEAVEAGTVDQAAVDAALTRVLVQKFELGLFENPYALSENAPRAFDTREHRALARRIAEQSIVLLKNEGDVLPFSTSPGKVAVIGPCADSVRLLQGDYHWPTHAEVMFGRIVESAERVRPAELPPMASTVEGDKVDLSRLFVPHVALLPGVRRAVSPATVVGYARGCDVLDDDRSGIAEAVALAQSSNVAIVAVGTRSGLVEGSTSGESSDRSDLSLTSAQIALVDAVIATGTPTAVVLLNGGILSIPELAERAPVIVEAWVPGEEGGNAIAAVLFGDVNPAGRLPVSLPRSVGQVPVFYNHKPSGGRTNWRGDYVDGPSTPLFPFGHGLSYTTFEYGDLGLSATEVAADGALEVSVRVTNSGERTGDEVVQLYVHDLVASCSRPVMQLSGFARVRLKPAETQDVSFRLDMSQLAFYNPAMEFIVEAGAVEVMVGASSGDIRRRATFMITGGRKLSIRDVLRTPVTVTTV